MDLSNPGITYAFLIIPAAFALVVLLQGIEKMTKQEKDGPVAVGFGVFFFVLIGAAYFLFIR